MRMHGQKLLPAMLPPTLLPPLRQGPESPFEAPKEAVGGRTLARTGRDQEGSAPGGGSCALPCCVVWYSTIDVPSRSCRHVRSSTCGRAKRGL